MGDRTGSPNKNKEFLLKRLKDMYGDEFDPIINACENAVRMSDIAKESQSTLSEDEFMQRKECVQAWDKIAQYVTPKLKAMEVSGEIQHKPHEAWLDLLNDE